MTYNVFSGTLNPTHFTSVRINCGRGSVPFDDNAIRYVLLVLWMTSCLPMIGQARTTPTGRMFKVTHHGQHGFDTYANMAYGKSSSPVDGTWC